MFLFIVIFFFFSLGFWSYFMRRQPRRTEIYRFMIFFFFYLSWRSSEQKITKQTELIRFPGMERNRKDFFLDKLLETNRLEIIFKWNENDTLIRLLPFLVHFCEKPQNISINRSANEEKTFWRKDLNGNMIAVIRFQ